MKQYGWSLAAALMVGVVLGQPAPQASPREAAAPKANLHNQCGRPIEHVHFSGGVERALYANGIYHLGVLVQHSRRELLSLKDLNRTSVAHVEAVLDSVGLRLGLANEVAQCRWTTLPHPPRIQHETRAQKQLINALAHYERNPTRRATILARHQEALFDLRFDDPALSHRLPKVLEALWVHFDYDVPLDQLGQRLFKRTGPWRKGHGLVRGVIVAQVRDLERQGLLRLAVALDRESVAHGEPAHETWRSGLPTHTMPRKKPRPKKPVASQPDPKPPLLKPVPAGTALAVLDRPVGDLHLPISPHKLRLLQIFRIGDLVQHTPKTLGAWIRPEQLRRTIELLGFVRLDLGLNAGEAGWTGSTSSYAPVGQPSRKQMAETVRGLTAGKLQQAAQDLGNRISDHRGIEIVLPRWPKHRDRPSLNDLRHKHGVSRERVRQIERDTMVEFYQWLDRLSVKHGEITSLWRHEAD